MMVVKLKQARAMLAGGWVGPDVEPFCLARAPGLSINPLYGQPCEPLWLTRKVIWTLDPQHEGVELYSVICALEAVGLGLAAFDLLEEACKPPAGFQTWLRASGRLTQHVLDVFTKAIQRSKKATRSTTGERR